MFSTCLTVLLLLPIFLILVIYSLDNCRRSVGSSNHWRSTHSCLPQRLSVLNQWTAFMGKSCLCLQSGSSTCCISPAAAACLDAKSLKGKFGAGGERKDVQIVTSECLLLCVALLFNINSQNESLLLPKREVKDFSNPDARWCQLDTELRTSASPLHHRNYPSLIIVFGKTKKFPFGQI